MQGSQVPQQGSVRDALPLAENVDVAAQIARCRSGFLQPAINAVGAHPQRARRQGHPTHPHRSDLPTARQQVIHPQAFRRLPFKGHDIGELQIIPGP